MSRVLVVQLARFVGTWCRPSGLSFPWKTKVMRSTSAWTIPWPTWPRLVYPRAVLHPIQAHAAGLSAAEAARVLLTDNRPGLCRTEGCGF